ncbi:MAG: hypothetical protein EBZ48_10245 [Proteobacteria bacterium]|nr:hypothetical protein [Pseudomonadota bacterium]
MTIATILSFIALCARFVVNQLPQIGGALILICLLSALQVCTPGAHLYYPSDTLAVLIVILCYLTLFSGRIVSFYSLFILGSFNRETTVFLLPLLWFLPPDVLNGPTKPSFAGTLQGPLHSLVLLGLWVSIKLSLFTTFRQNQGLFLHPNFIGNVIALQSLPTLCAFLLPVLACATVALYAARRCGDPRLAAAGYACMVYVVGIFLAGALRELRVYDELMPLIALCLLVALTPKTRLVGLTLRRVS